MRGAGGGRLPARRHPCLLSGGDAVTFLDNLHNYRFWRNLNRFQKFMMATSSILIVAMICIAVVARYIFESDFYGSEELISMVAFWLYFMGAAQGSHDKSQISADIVSCYIKGDKTRRIMHIVTDLVTLAICLLVTTWAVQFVAWGFKMNPKSPVFRLPMLIPQCAVGLGFILMSWYHLVYLVQDIRTHLKLVRQGS